MNAWIVLFFILNYAICNVNGFYRFPIIPDELLNTTELIRSKGYPAEDHDVLTQDGYILSIQRIPASRKGRPVVFLQHGLLDASSTWVMNFPNQSLAFILSDNGYDVWLGNLRGNTYGRRHVSLSTNDEKFWDFSWDEMSQYDLIAMVNYALKITNQESLYYVGHSQGTMISFAQLSKNQEFASKIRLFLALGPVTTIGHLKGPVGILAELGRFSKELIFYNIFGKKMFLPSNEIITWLGNECSIPIVGKDACQNVFFILCGPSKYLNITRIPVYVAHTPAGTSVKNMVHFAQMKISDKFQMYDYGSKKENLLYYNQTEPPVYNVKNINVPVALYWAQNDWMADPVDVDALRKLLPNVVDNLNIELYNHLDFIWGTNAKEDLYDRMLKLMQKY